MLKKKKILFFAVIILVLFSTTDVFAKIITCDYGNYVLKYDTLYYKKDYISGNDGNCDDKPLCLIDKSKPNPLAFSIAGNLNKLFVFDSDTCPKKIYISIPEMFQVSSKPSSGDIGTYELASTSVKNSVKTSCGNITGIPKKIPELTSYGITIVQIAIPVILVIMGSIDLFKGITAQKEDEIKKGQQMFIKRLIVASLIFFVVVIVKLLISVIDQSSKDNISSCIDCFISNDCD